MEVEGGVAVEAEVRVHRLGVDRKVVHRLAVVVGFQDCFHHPRRNLPPHLVFPRTPTRSNRIPLTPSATTNNRQTQIIQSNQQPIPTTIPILRHTVQWDTIDHHHTAHCIHRQAVAVITLGIPATTTGTQDNGHKATSGCLPHKALVIILLGI